MPAAHGRASGDCVVAYPTTELTAGQLVNGLTVSQGVTPSPFTGEVLGVLKDGVLPGIDLVMARLDSTAIEEVGGIWQGMSGAPVYAADGRLIGAVAYGLSWGPSPVAGITPFAQMQTSLNRTLPTKVAVGDQSARLLARASGVTRAQAQQGFSGCPRRSRSPGCRPKPRSARPPGPTCPSPRRWPARAAAVTPDEHRHRGRRQPRRHVLHR